MAAKEGLPNRSTAKPAAPPATARSAVAAVAVEPVG
jgi:hypothetical protein